MEKKQSLFDCAALIADVESAINETGEIDQDQERQLIVAHMTAVDKAQKIVNYVNFLDSRHEAYKKEIESKTKIAKAIENKKQRVLSYMKDCVEVLPDGKFDLGTTILKIKKCPPKCEVDIDFDVAEYLTQPEPPAPKPDKKKILTDLKNGIAVKGARLIQNTRLEIK